ncbi:hypothetical protein FRB94_010513 [Tulasnella sp. JGI-2019a]|nr:hypothetical protein FRB94_010513 [Tulasnella sp. JGI-2019a]
MSTSWWSRRSGPKPIVTDLPTNRFTPPSSSVASSASVASPYGANPPYQSTHGAAHSRGATASNHPASSYVSLATSLAPSNRSNMRKTSNDSRVKIIQPTSTLSSGASSTFGNFFGMGGGSNRSRKLSEAGYSVNDSDIITDASSINTSAKSNARNRGYTLSSSTASTQWPITPGASTDGRAPHTDPRSRSNSTASALSKRVGPHQLPSLLSVEEYDPFASGTNSFHVLPTPPPLTPDSQSFGDLLNSTFKLPPSSPLRDEYFDERAQEKARPATHGLRLVVQPLNLSRRPSAPTTSTLAPAVNQDPGPNSAGPFPKKPMPLLPFRTKPGKDKKSSEPMVEKPEHSSRFGNLLRPRAATPTSRISTHSTDSSGRSGNLSSLGTRQTPQPVTSPPSPSIPTQPDHPMSNKSSQSDLTSTSRRPSGQRQLLSHQSSFASLAPPPSPVRDPSKRRAGFLSMKPFAETTTAVTLPAAPPPQVTSPEPANPRPRPTSTESKSSNDSLKGRLRASLAITVHEMDDMIMGATKAGGIDLDMELDSELARMAAHSLSRETTVQAHGKTDRDDDGNVVEIILPPANNTRGKVSPILCERGEETGEFELLLPPKPGEAGCSPSSVLSSSAEKYFISPYPTGMPVVGSFDSEEARESSDEEGGVIPLPTPSFVVERGMGFTIEPLRKERKKSVGASRGGGEGLEPLAIRKAEPKAAVAGAVLEPRLERMPELALPPRSRSALEMIQDAIVSAAAATSQVLLYPTHDYIVTTPTPTTTTTPMLRHGTSAMPLALGRSYSHQGHGSSPSPKSSPQHPSRLHIPSRPSHTTSRSNSSTTSPREPLTPMHFRNNPVMTNIAASASDLSMSLSQSGRNLGTLDRVDDEDEDDLSDLDASFVTSYSSLRKRRGSEPASTKSRMDPALGTSFGVTSLLGGTSPPLPSIPVPRSRNRSRDYGSPSPPTAKLIPNGSGSVSRGRTRTTSGPLAILGASSMQSFIKAMASSASGSMSEEGGSSMYTARSVVTGPKRQKSFNIQPNLPPVPSLRHFSSFTTTKAPATTLTSIAGQFPSPASPPAPKPISLGGAGGSESGHRSSSVKRKFGRDSKASVVSSQTVGPKGETMDTSLDWALEKSRYTKDDDTRSLAVTLNRFPSSERRSTEDAGPATSFTDSVSSSPSAKSLARKAKSTSPVRSDYSMHILPPSQLLRVGEIFYSDNTRDRALAELAQDDDLLHGDFDDMGSILSEAGGLGWGTESLLREPSPLPITSLANRTAGPMRAIYEGRPNSSRPSTSDSTTAIRSQGLAPRHRPSTSQGSTKSTGVGTRRGPLSPPPLRSRLPRSSISSSMRSAPGATVNPLTPAPRSRAMSNIDNGANDRRSTATQSTTGSTTSRGIYTAIVECPSPRNSLLSVTSKPETKSVHSQARTPKKVLSPLEKSKLLMKRQTLKPSFLDIDFDDEMEETELHMGSRHESKPSLVLGNRTLRGLSNGMLGDKMQRLKRESTSFLDLERGSLDSIRD